MAFTKNTFLPNSAQANSDAPRTWTFRTTDTKADIAVSNYFADVIDLINDGDFCFFNASDGNNYGFFVKTGGNISLSVNASTFNPTTDMTIERVLDGVSTLASQQPTGTGEANQVQITFGPAVNSGSDPVQLLADGTLRVNEAGTYRIKVSFVFGRSGAAGISQLRFRALINGVQAGVSIGANVDASDVAIPYADEAWLTLPAGIDITYEVMRDSSGNNSGGLFEQTVTAATAASWNSAPCSAIRVERWI